MTSTSFNIGVDADAKNSSRVLRPPGGGHTDIFGLHEPAAPLPSRREDNRRNASSILEGTDQGKPQTNDESKTVKIEEKKQTEPTQPTEDAPKKVRVPPGGFSSGLW